MDVKNKYLQYSSNSSYLNEEASNLKQQNF